MPQSPALLSLASSLGTNPTWLDRLIAFESGWNPRAYNASSGATGLIQFMPRTMKEFGLIPADIAARIPAKGDVPAAVEVACKNAFLARYPTVELQLAGPVKTYLKRYAPFPTEQSLYMAVFYPAYRNVAPTKPFPDSVQRANPGIDTAGAYVAKVQRKAGVSGGAKASGLGVAAIAATALLLLNS